MIAVAGVNRAALWPMIFVTLGLSVAAHFGAFSSSEPVAVAGALDAGACADLMRGVAAGVSGQDDALLPEPGVLRRFEGSRFDVRGVGTDAAGAAVGVRGQRDAGVVVHLGEGARWAKSLRAAPHEGRWRFLGSSD